MNWRWFIVLSLALIVAFIFLFNSGLHLMQNLSHYNKQRENLILFIPGLGLEAKDYHTLISNLEDDHYEVISFNPKDSTATNYQSIVNKWTSEISKIIGKRKVIVIGHSVGGSVAAHFCSIDDRCIAGIDLDGGAVFNENIQVPFLYLQADYGSYCDEQCFKGRSLMEKIATQSGVTLIHINGIKHYNFTDLRTQQLKNEDYLGPQDGRKFIYANIKTFLKQLSK